jgi:hypothetical protein
MSSSTENIIAGLFALALLPVIGWRIWRGLKQGELPLYRTRIDRSVGAAKFNFLLGLHVLIFALIAADLLVGIGLRGLLGLSAG